MPNWCNNQLMVRGPAEDVRHFKAKAVGHSPWLPLEARPDKPNPLNFHSLCPVPDELLKGGYGEAVYKWEQNHWGCKWGGCETQIVDESDEYIKYAFDTPWSPPLEFIAHVARDWPRLSFVIEYEEPGNGLKGQTKIQGNQSNRSSSQSKRRHG